MLIGFIPDIPLIVGVLSLTSAFLVLGVVLYIAGYWAASTEPITRTIVRAGIVTVTVPFYWLLQWLADIRAFKQLASGNLEWEKTVHENAGRFEELRHAGAREDRDLRAFVWSRLTADLRVYPLLVAAFLVRLPELDRSLWLDEAYTVVERGSESIVGILLTVEPHPPLYYLLVHGWMGAFGNSEVAVRLLSVFIGVAAVGAGYLLAARLYDRDTGLVMAALLGVSSLQVHHAQSVRMYILVMLLSLLSLYFYLRVLDSQTVETRFAYGFTTVALLYTHVYGVFLVLAQLFHLATFVWRHRENAYTPALSVIKVATISGLAFLPWFLGMLVPNYLLTDDVGSASWIQEPTLATLRDIFYAYAGVPVSYPIIAFGNDTVTTGRVFLVLFGALFAYLLVRSVSGLSLADAIGRDLPLTRSDDGTSLPEVPSDVGGLHLAVAVLLSATILPYIVSYALFPILDVRYAVFGFIGFALILARGVTALPLIEAIPRRDGVPEQTLRVGGAVLLLVLASPGLAAYYQTDTSEKWGDLVEPMAESDLSNDLVVYNPEYTRLTGSYYLSSDGNDAAATYYLQLGGQEASNALTYENDAQIERTLAKNEFDHVWVITYTDTPNLVRSTLTPQFEQVGSRTTDNLRLIEYRRVSAGDEGGSESQRATAADLAPALSTRHARPVASLSHG